MKSQLKFLLLLANFNPSIFQEKLCQLGIFFQLSVAEWLKEKKIEKPE